MSKSIRQKLMELELNETTSFPPEKIRSVRTVASELGFITDRKFRVNAVRKESGNVLEVTRIR